MWQEQNQTIIIGKVPSYDYGYNFPVKDINLIGEVKIGTLQTQIHEVTGSLRITGSLLAIGPVTFGTTITHVHRITGSLNVTGSSNLLGDFTVTGSVLVKGDISGSLGTFNQLLVSASSTALINLRAGDRLLTISQGASTANAIYSTNNFHEFQTDATIRFLIADTVITSAVGIGISGSMYARDSVSTSGSVLISGSIINVQQSASVGLTISLIASVPVAQYTTAFFDYSIKNGTNMRAGTVIVVYNGTTYEYTEVGTVDLGNTSGVTLSADVASGNIRLLGVATTTG